MKLKFLVCALLFLLLSAATRSGLAAAVAPRFQGYPAKVYSGPVNAPDLSAHPEARTYRTRLKNLVKVQVNFAGEFILTSWGCGTRCIMGAHFHEFRDGEFRFIQTVETNTASAENWNCRNTAVEVSCNKGVCEVAKAHTPMDVSVSLAGEMTICAYSGCWQGKASSVVASGRYLTLTSRDLIWSHGSAKTGVEGTVTIDTISKTATIMIANFAHPMSCTETKLP